jgi:hypothetical protein
VPQPLPDPWQQAELVSRRTSPASRSSSSARSADTGPRVGRDGKVETACPNCGAQYRISPDHLDSKIECADCHRVFIAKSTAGKKVKPPDYTKAYVGFGVAAVAIIGLLMMMGGGDPPPKKEPVAAAPKAPQYGIGTHPRADQLAKWAQAVGSGNRLVLGTHSDLPALGKLLGVATPDDTEAVLQAIQTNDDVIRYLRELDCSSATLASESDMTSATGSGIVYLTPKPGDDVYNARFRGEFSVAFRMEGEQIKVTGFALKHAPTRNPGKGSAPKGMLSGNKDIAKPVEAEITDGAGTRKVQESKPGPVPHWDKATPELQQLADDVVSDVLRSADPEAPGGLLTRATLKVQTKEQRLAVTPRLLNAMNDCYADVMANNMKLSQLNRALIAVTGFAVNYRIEDSGDAAKDKTTRESCVRQWFAFWYSNHTKLDQWFDSRDNLEEPLEETPPKKSGK